MSTRPRRRRSSTAIACIILSTIILATLTPPAAAQPEQQPQQEGNNNSSAAEQQQNSASASPPPPPTEAPQQGNRSSNARVDGALLVPSADAAAGRLVLTPPGVLAGNFSQLSAACQEQLKALNLQNSVLPVVLIQLANTSGVSASAAQLQLLAKGPSLPGLMTTCGSPDGKDVENQPIKMNVRGSSSAVEYAKKSFGMDPVNQITAFAKAENDEIDLLGLPKGKDWVLHGPENDRTLGMRSWIGYNMARWIGRYASRTQYFELYLNTDPNTPLSAQHYRGVYMLQEKVARGKRRVNIEKLDFTADPSGGYMWAYENDNINAGAVLVTTRLSKLTMQMEYPKSSNDTVNMWLQQWLDGYETKLLSQPVANLSDVLDVPAAIDYFIITEITKNPDGYRGSIKMHKNRGGPLVMGPLWDLNEAFGLCCGYPIEGYQRGGASNGTSGGSAISAAGWRFNICQDPGRCKVEPADGVSQWYRRLWQDATFRTAAAARWQELRAPETGALRDARVTEEIAAVKRLIGSGPGTPGQRNFEKWSAALNVPGFGVPFADWAAMYDTETQMLSEWTLARLHWLDAAFAAQALPTAGPDAYLGVGAVMAEPKNAGPSRAGAVGAGAGAAGGGASGGIVPAVAGR